MFGPKVKAYVPLMSWIGKLMRNVRAARLAGVPAGLGVTVMGDGVTSSDQATRVPCTPVVSSITCRVQVPAIRLPVKALSAWAGRKVPVKGAVPALMDVAALSSKVVPLKLAPNGP